MIKRLICTYLSRRALWAWNPVTKRPIATNCYGRVLEWLREKGRTQ